MTMPAGCEGDDFWCHGGVSYEKKQYSQKDNIRSSCDHAA